MFFKPADRREGARERRKEIKEWAVEKGKER